MKNFFKSFFSTSNEINENVVIGVIFVAVLIVATFIVKVDADKYYVLAGLVAACFTLGAIKR